MSPEGFYRDNRDVRRVEYLLRAIVTAIIALSLVLAAIYQAVWSHEFTGPIVAWAGLVIGVYIGGHLGANGSSLPRPRRATDPPPS